MRLPLIAASVVGLMAVSGCSDDSSLPSGPTSNFANVTPDSLGGRGRDTWRDLAGLYVLTFTAAPACSQIPAPLRTRTYSGLLKPNDMAVPGFTAELGGAEFFAGYDTFWWDAAHGNQAIIERVTPNAFLSFNGTTSAPIMTSVAPFTAAFDGSISFCSVLIPPLRNNVPPTCANPVQCQSDRHQIRFARR